MTMRLAISVLALLLMATGPAWAEPKVETVAGGLNNPSGLAIQPETGQVFVADSGAGRVIRVVDGKAEDVIVGFPQDVYGKGPMYNIGPLGLAFLGQDTLVVGGGGKPDGEELLRVYKVPEAGGEPLKAEDMVASFSLPALDGAPGEGNFYALAVNDDAIYVTCNGDDTKGWVSRAVRDGEGAVTGFERWLATKEATQVDAPVAATLSPRGELVVGQGGEVNIPRDSLLTFYSAKDGKMLLNLETDLFDITGLAYGPDGQLYATDFAWMAPGDGGLYQLIATNEDGEQGCEAKLITGLDKPSALAFGKDGELYVTVFGTAAEGSDEHPGKLVKIEM